MIHQALYNLYPNITSIVDGEDSLKIFEGSKEITDTIDMVEAEAQAAILTQDAKKSQLRAERDKKIAETDWWASTDLNMTQEQEDYRQALRDITDVYTSLDDVVWPVKP